MQKKERYKLPISGMGNELSLLFLQKYKGWVIRKSVLLNDGKFNNFDEMENSFEDIKFLESTKARSRRNS